MRSLRARSLAGAAVTGALVLGGAGWAYAAGSGGDPSYRFASVATGDVQQTIALSGTLDRSSSSALAFGASGTVSSVKVSVGDAVKRGQVIARLDTTDLTASVSAAEAKVANAKATLASDQQAQVDAATAEDDAEAAEAAAQASAARAKKQAAAAAKKQAAAAAAAAAKLRQQQQAVTSAQTDASKALAAASSALEAQQTACATAFTPTDPADASSIDSAATAACTDALTAVDDAQGTAQKAQQALQKALATLTTSLKGSGSSTSGGTATQGGSQGGSAGSSGSSTSTGGGSGMGSREVTAATLASDQASIDQAEADLITAQQNLDGAVITAPTAGTIGALDVAKGDTVSAGTSLGTLLGSGTVTLTIGVSATQAAELAADQVAHVLPAGAEEALDAHVTRVSHVASADSTGSSTYPVLITLDASDLTLPQGGTAAVDVVVGTAADVLTVPTSAVSSGTVQVLKDGAVTRTKVTTGLVGASRTQITDGLDAGDQVVLADLDAELPTSSTSSNSRTGFGGGTGGPAAFSRSGVTGGGIGGGGR